MRMGIGPACSVASGDEGGEGEDEGGEGEWRTRAERAVAAAVREGRPMTGRTERAVAGGGVRGYARRVPSRALCW